MVQDPPATNAALTRDASHRDSNTELTAPRASPLAHEERALSAENRCLANELVLDESPWMTATGIPPQVVMFGLQKEIQATVCALPESLAARFAKLLEEKGIYRTGITQQQLEDTMRRVLADRESRSDAVCPHGTPPTTTIHFWPCDGKLHALPESFEFPSTDVRHAWHQWWFRNEAEGQPPYKSVSTHDLATRKKRQTYSDWRMIMKHISAAIERETGALPPSSMTEQQAAMLCVTGVNSLPLSPSTSSRRTTQLKVTTMFRLVRQAAHQNNQNPRTLEYRPRKKRKKTKRIYL
ncbi:hypothetical protein ON010_g3202 [Phytophthora cinnamomi]|nr:hypothetical protein ON010_g3202 [Phytophthora cinnamomi]